MPSFLQTALKFVLGGDSPSGKTKLVSDLLHRRERLDALGYLRRDAAGMPSAATR
jgi:hypothetical protein